MPPPAGIQSNSQYSEQLLVMFSLVMIQLKQVCTALLKWGELEVGGVLSKEVLERGGANGG